jgi:hypothetical protein
MQRLGAGDLCNGLRTAHGFVASNVVGPAYSAMVWWTSLAAFTMQIGRKAGLATRCAAAQASALRRRSRRRSTRAMPRPVYRRPYLRVRRGDVGTATKSHHGFALAQRRSLATSGVRAQNGRMAEGRVSRRESSGTPVPVWKQRKTGTCVCVRLQGEGPGILAEKAAQGA